MTKRAAKELPALPRGRKRSLGKYCLKHHRKYIDIGGRKRCMDCHARRVVRRREKLEGK